MLKMWSLFIVTANSYLPKECNSCPKMVLRVSLNSVSQDTRLTAAPVLTNFLVRISKLKFGILMSCGRFVLLVCVRLLWIL
jgi:hypothetical protein